MLFNMMNMMAWQMGFGGFLWYAILIGLAVLVWLWVIKLFKEVSGKKR